MTAPSSSPDPIIASCALRAATVTARSSKPAAVLNADHGALAVFLKRVAGDDDRPGSPGQRHVERRRQVGHQVRMCTVDVDEHDEIADLRRQDGRHPQR